MAELVIVGFGNPTQEAKLQAALSRAHPPSPSEGVEAAGTMAAHPA
jgi:hypothetical protein